MTQTFPELVVGGVLIAPFVTYAALALVICIALRPILYIAGLDRVFTAPPVAQLGLYVIVLALLIAFA